MDVTTALHILDAQGYVIIPNLLTPTAIEELRAAVASHEANHPLGRNDFEGESTHRIYSLARDAAILTKIAEHPFLLEMLDALLLPNFLLSNLQSIRIYPGETVQPLHTDDAFYLGYARPRPLILGLSTIWALDDFTETNGATEVIPGSHRWGVEHPDDVPSAKLVKAVMKAGSCLVFNPGTWHRGGANVSSQPRLAITAQYCQPWLRPQESQLLVMPPDAARALSARGKAMLGYSIHPPFIGQVDGKHPARLVDEEEFRRNRTPDAMIARQVLKRPMANL